MGTAPILGISPLRMGSDGQGVTTLVGFYGCNLRCRYCLNPHCFAPDAKVTRLTARELYEKVKHHALYYLATGGGVTFGGGEPLLQVDFLQEFRALCGEEWHLCAETSLAVPRQQVEKAAKCIDMFYVDCKDVNPEIYRSYTGQDNGQMLQNLKLLLALVGSKRIVARLPLIPDHNTEEDRQRSQQKLSDMGITRFDLFTYKK